VSREPLEWLGLAARAESAALSVSAARAARSELEETSETPDSQDLLALEASKVVEALRALPERLATQDLAVLLVRADLWALLVKTEGMEAMAALAPRVRLDLPGLPAPRVNAGLRAHRASEEPPAPPAPPGSSSRSIR
jgi:hypothetical protein